MSVPQNQVLTSDSTFELTLKADTNYLLNLENNFGGGVVVVSVAHPANGQFISLKPGGWNAAARIGFRSQTGVVKVEFTGSISPALWVGVSEVDEKGGLLLYDSAASPTPVSLAGEVVATTGFIDNPSASFTRPNDTTAYAANDLVANHITVGSVVFPSITVTRVPGGSFMARRCKLAKSGANITNASFRVHVFRAAPVPANGDNGVFSANGVANYLGAFDVTMDRVFTDGACGFGYVVSGPDISAKLATGVSNVACVLQALAPYTPIANEVFTITFDDLQN